MNYTAVLWDLDGTIVDSGPGIFDSFRKTFAALGTEQPTDAQLRTFIGPPMRETFATILGYGPELTEKALAVYRNLYHAGGATNAIPYPGVIDLIAASKAACKANSLATSKAYRGAMVVGEHFDFIKYFDVLGTADFDANRFHKTDVVAYAIDGLRAKGADLSRVILIGDRIHDIEGARDHGIEVALVKWGYGNPDEWAQADHVIETPQDLAKLLGI